MYISKYNSQVPHESLLEQILSQIHIFQVLQENPSCTKCVSNIFQNAYIKMYKSNTYINIYKKSKAYHKMYR